MGKVNRVASVGMLLGLALGTCLVVTAPAARALTTADRPAAILTWPKIVVDVSGLFGDPTDTLIQLSNTSNQLKQAHCFYVNANSHCGAAADNAGAVCQSATQCPSGSGQAACEAGWNEIDFDVFLTADQPLGWHASSGLGNGEFPINVTGTCTNRPVQTCSEATAFLCPGGKCDTQQSNVGSAIPPVPETPFLGTLTCIEFDPKRAVPDQGSTTNTLVGHGTIQTTLSDGVLNGVVTVQKYNAVGLKATQNGNTDNVLQIGGDPGSPIQLDPPQPVEYEACPSTLVLHHLFDQSNLSDFTDLTLVPCGDNFLNQGPGVVTAQFLVFNEFEQRFSTSTTVDCFFEEPLSSIGTSVPGRSIFNFAVAGTYAGQTRIRGIGNAPTGRGLIGVARPFFNGQASAYNLVQSGTPDFVGLMGAVPVQPDVITIP